MRRTTVLSTATIALLLGACATAAGPGGGKSYGLDVQYASAAVARGEGREALAYYEAQAAQLEGGGALSRGRAVKAHSFAALVATNIGAYQKGIRHGLRALELLETLPAYWETDLGKLQVHLWLGLTYLQVGDLDEARRRFETVLELAGRRSQYLESLWVAAELAMGRIGLGAVAHRQGDYTNAVAEATSATLLMDEFLSRLDYLNQWRLDIRRNYSVWRANHLEILVLALVIAGGAQWELKELDAAEASFRRALEVATELGTEHYRVIARFGLAAVAAGRSDLERAERETRQLVQGDRRLAFFTTFILSKVANQAARRGRHETALQLFQEAMRAVEEARSELEESGLRGLFLEDKQAMYHGAVQSALALGQVEDAFGFAERGRARAFLDLLGTHTTLARGSTRALAAEEERVRARLGEAQASTQLIVAGDTTAPGGGMRGAGSPVRDIAIDEYQAFVDRVRKENLEQASLMTVEPVTVREVQALLPEGTTLLEYLVTEQETVVWMVERSRVEAVRLPVSRSMLVAEVRALRNAIAEPSSVEAVQRHAETLYERLVAPARPHIRHDRLLIVPHDVLHYLPFAALRTPEGRWLVEDYTPATLPSASVLKYLGGKGKDAVARALIVGNPEGGAGLNLPWAEREARAVGEYYPGATVLLRRDATESVAKALSGTAGLLHFATHGELNERDPLSSALILTPDDKEDGRLEVREIFRLELNARLVVLSACETGLGRLSKGDELVGLQRAFLYAGTPAVITTLWKVEDRATYELMRVFHGQLKTSGPADALRQAQRTTMRDFPHPFFWAAFGLTGVPR